MDASKVSVGGRTYDLNYLGKVKKTNLRRKLIVEYIQSKPAGEYIKTREFQDLGKFSSAANTHTFIKRMIRDGIIARHEGEKPKTAYYSIIGSVRVKQPVTPKEAPADPLRNPNIGQFIADMQKLGVKFTITISNEEVDNAK